MYIFFNILGLLLFLFFYYKRLKEDYGSQIIFSTGFIIAIVGGLFYAASQLIDFLPKQYWYWFALLGATFGYVFSLFRYKLKFFESLEAYGVGLLFWQGIIFLGHSVTNTNVFSLGATLVIIGLLILFFFFEGVYKNLAWYRSGRVGFSGLVTLGTFFLIRSAIALSFDNVLSFVGKIDAIVSGVVALGLFLALYLLARK